MVERGFFWQTSFFITHFFWQYEQMTSQPAVVCAAFYIVIQWSAWHIYNEMLLKRNCRIYIPRYISHKFSLLFPHFYPIFFPLCCSFPRMKKTMNGTMKIKIKKRCFFRGAFTCTTWKENESGKYSQKSNKNDPMFISFTINEFQKNDFVCISLGH